MDTNQSSRDRREEDLESIPYFAREISVSGGEVKKALLVLLALPAMLCAETVAWTEKAGGEMVVLTSKYCSGLGNLAYLVSDFNNTVHGCWTKDDFLVHIRWDNGEYKSYMYTSFKQNTAKNKGLPL